ncbi:MAG: hypothetical protein IJ072_06390 [Oscillospiraceae bacterium]|nr:hypothetical protein [Oscillospiraceae bacterium]
MFELRLASGTGCAAVEKWGDTVVVKEFLVPESELKNAAALILNAVPGERIVIRTPAKTMEDARPFAMGKNGWSDNAPLPWYGFAFD